MKKDKKRRSDVLAERIEQRLEQLARLTDEARISDAIRSYLDAMAQFHRYSSNNVFLIALQCPHATRVAGYRTWQDLGGQVRKGEQGIKILCPRPWKRTEVDEDTGEEEVVARGTWFAVGHVFDISQVGVPCPECVDDEDKPTLAPPLADRCSECGAQVEPLLPPEPKWINEGEEGEELANRLRRFAEAQGIEVVRDVDLPGHKQGRSWLGRIELRRGITPLGRAAVTAHEVAHELLHGAPERTLGRRQALEVEAEATAYVVLAHYGHQILSPNYLALWSADGEQIRERLERVSATAQRIIEGVESPEDLQEEYR